jgi:hypothetical protein
MVRSTKKNIEKRFKNLDPCFAKFKEKVAGNPEIFESMKRIVNSVKKIKP